MAWHTSPITIVSVLAMFLAASPTIVRVDMQDALRLPSGFETPPGSPLIILIKAPSTWVAKNALTTIVKDAVLASTDRLNSLVIAELERIARLHSHAATRLTPQLERNR
ncbi:MAG: hypothetical protein Q8N26_02300 [Myxococcales bacterium]|nr:hypothetical protein [Myxococcales bacterium]